MRKLDQSLLNGISDSLIFHHKKRRVTINSYLSYLKTVQESSFFELLFRIDEEFANKLHGRSCPRCGAGKLCFANYLRKPRGGPKGAAEKCDLRFSLCCDREGCRKRLLPKSVRFLERKVYFSAVVVIASVIHHGNSPKRAERLKELFCVTRQTLDRWRRWWKEHFPGSFLWRREKIHFMGLAEGKFPENLLEHFTHKYRRARDALEACLMFLSRLNGEQEI